ncbi:uncharacterized protein CXQ87_004582 [Candidozyma duobushaemuli]|uniref:Prokaryotic-type class I peptide chain release factors domain-containing protein n=1 Tax=Candidozyma duobushaemuli TaxID=1231522 RepID=A0A2V1AIG0_9ASCO|nr:uncharacterized protein CXQ87_004582 [[Candida] duobushaemulonis]PVH17023.1 hypothetical protein CXQ87_004582 [[Candida] duobushaemulonis]
MRSRFLTRSSYGSDKPVKDPLSNAFKGRSSFSTNQSNQRTIEIPRPGSSLSQGTDVPFRVFLRQLHHQVAQRRSLSQPLHGNHCKYITPLTKRSITKNGFNIFLSTSSPRFYSQKSFSKEEIEEAKRWLDNPQINRAVFEITYSRSSGPGGQKVNKTSSKATVALEPWKWLNPQFCFWIPKPILAQIEEKRIRYHTKSGGLLIQSDRSRNREDNTADCFKKLGDEIRRVVEFEGKVSEEDKAKWEELAKVSKERRMEQKKRQKEKKQGRSKKFDLG